MNSDTFECLDTVSVSICAAKRYYLMWRTLRFGNCRDNYEDTMNEYLYFSRAMISGSFHLAIIILYKALEKGKSSGKNLTQLLKLLEKDGYNKSVLDSYNKKIKNYTTTAKGVGKLRNITLAHNGHTSFKDAFKKADLKEEDLFSFINELETIVNDIHDHLKTSGRQSVGKAHEELEKIFENLEIFHSKQTATQIGKTGS